MLPGRSTLTNLVWAVSFLILAAMGSFQLWTIFSRNQIVHEIHEIRALNSPVEQGGLLHLRLVASRHKDCRAVVHRFLFRKGDQQSIWSEMTAGGLTRIGDNVITKFSIKLPDWVPPGHYQYLAVVYNDCGDNLVPVRPPKPAEFDIIPKKR